MIVIFPAVKTAYMLLQWTLLSLIFGTRTEVQPPPNFDTPNVACGHIWNDKYLQLKTARTFFI